MKNKTKRLLLIGGTGFLGKNICKFLDSVGVEYLAVGTDLVAAGYRSSLLKVIDDFQPTGVIFLAAKVGSMASIKQRPLDFLLTNIQLFADTYSVFQECAKNNNKFDIVNIVSNCVYPAIVDVQYENLIETGEPHKSVESFAQAKRTLISLGRSLKLNYNVNVLNLILANSFGPFDHLDSSRSHALTGMLVRMIEAKRNNEQSFVVWGTGKPVRSWLYAPDFARQVPEIFNNQSFWVNDVLNFPPTLPEITIEKLAVEIAKGINFKGEIRFDESMGDGDPIKVLNSDKYNDIYKPKMSSFSEALISTIDYFENN